MPPFLIVALIAIPLGAAIVVSQSSVALVVPAVTGALGLIVLCHALADPKDPAVEHRILHWTMGAFAVHLLLGLVITNTPSAVYYLGGDAGTYQTFARWIVEFGKGSLAGRLEIGKEGFYYMLVGLYKVFGFHSAAGLAVNAMLGAALVPLVTDTTRRLFGPYAARPVAPIVVLFPSIFLFSSQLLKEAPILFLISVALNAAVRMVDRVSPGNLVALTTSLAVLLTFRGPIAAVAGVALLAGIALGKREVLSGLTAGFSALAVLAVLVIGIGVGQSGVQSAIKSSSLKESNRVRAGLAYQTQSGFGSEVDTSTASQALTYLPVGLTRFAFGPFPWEIRGVRQLPALVDALVLWWFAPKAWRGLRSALRTHGRRLAVLLLPAGAMAFVLSLAVGNLGILVRERMQVLILVVPIIALGVSLRQVATTTPDAEQLGLAVLPSGPALSTGTPGGHP